MKLQQLLKIIIFTSLMGVLGNNLALASEEFTENNSRKLAQSSPPANNNATQVIKVTGGQIKSNG